VTADTVVTSTNGVDWSTQVSGITNNLNAIVFGNGLFVAGGDGGTILTSADGVLWAHQRAASTNVIYGLDFGNNQFVAVGGRGLILSSPDGAHWVRQPSTLSNDILLVAFGNNTFVVSDGQRSSISTNGMQWTTSQGIRFFDGINSIAFGAGNFFAVGTDGSFGQPSYFSSIDGANWTGADMPYEQFTTPLAAGFGNGQFVTIIQAYDTNGEYVSVLLSVDAAASQFYSEHLWSTSNPFVVRNQEPQYLQSLGFWHDRFVAVGLSGAIFLSGALPPYLSQITPSGNATTVGLCGPPQQAYVLQASPTLNGAWQPVATNTTASDGTLTFTDPMSSVGGSRFYRVLSQ
jgi:hypothetical protein